LTKKVEFISMNDGTKNDYDLIAIHDSDNERKLFNRVINWLKMMEQTLKLLFVLYCMILVMSYHHQITLKFRQRYLDLILVKRITGLF